MSAPATQFCLLLWFSSHYYSLYFPPPPPSCSTLAGGVVIGAACDMLDNPWGALLAGSVAGAVSVYGFSYLVPALKRRGLTDTCGISSLHFMPGLIGGVASAIAAGSMDDAKWSAAGLVETFPARATRSALTQGGYQMAMTAISLGFGLLGGWATGWLMTLPWADPMNDSFYEDEGAWNVPFDEEESPEQDTDIALALAQAKAEMMASLLAQINAALPAGSKPIALPTPPAGMTFAGVPSSGGGNAISANNRFTEGSVHGGAAAGDGSVGKGSAAGRRAHGPPEGSVRAGRAFLAASASSNTGSAGSVPQAV